MRPRGLFLALAVVSMLGGCGHSQATSADPNAAEVRAALEARLVGKSLSFRWVVCVETDRLFAGRSIFRCNVNFGEPHIVRYCATLGDGHLVTNREQPEMRCGRDER